MAAELQKHIAALIERGLVDLAAIVEGDLKVSDAARCNRNQRLESRRGPSCLNKRPEEGKGRMLAADSYPPLFPSLHQPGVWILSRLSPARRQLLRILLNEEGLSLKLSALLLEWRSRLRAMPIDPDHAGVLLRLCEPDLVPSVLLVTR